MVGLTGTVAATRGSSQILTDQSQNQTKKPPGKGGYFCWWAVLRTSTGHTAAGVTFQPGRRFPPLAVGFSSTLAEAVAHVAATAI